MPSLEFRSNFGINLTFAKTKVFGFSNSEETGFPRFDTVVPECDGPTEMDGHLCYSNTSDCMAGYVVALLTSTVGTYSLTQSPLFVANLVEIGENGLM